MYLVINKCVTAVKVSNFSCHYLRNRSTLDICVLGHIGIVQHKEHSPEVLSIPPGTPCIQELGLSVPTEWTLAMSDYGGEGINICPCRGWNSGRPSPILSFTDTVKTTRIKDSFRCI